MVGTKAAPDGRKKDATTPEKWFRESVSINAGSSPIDVFWISID